MAVKFLIENATSIRGSHEPISLTWEIRSIELLHIICLILNSQDLDPIDPGCFVWWFSPGTHVSSNNKSDLHDITEILLKVTLNTIDPIQNEEAMAKLKNYIFSNVWSSLKENGTVGHVFKEDQARTLQAKFG